jgi:hypothetical protein
VTPQKSAKFVEMKGFGAKRGALVGGLVGVIGGPVGMVAGRAIGALASKLRDSGSSTIGSSSSARRSALVTRQLSSTSRSTPSRRGNSC